MNTSLLALIKTFSEKKIPNDRKEVLDPLAAYITGKVSKGDAVRLNFICTHNSRRSHLSQIWAQTMAYHFGLQNVFCYSGGTEATAMFPKISETLAKQGFEVIKLSETNNPVYAVKFAQNEQAIICFSKLYDHIFNPASDYAAVVTCNSADEACPMVLGAEARFPVKYDDPKAFDNTERMDEAYRERSMQIAEEMLYLFSKVQG